MSAHFPSLPDKTGLECPFWCQILLESSTAAGPWLETPHCCPSYSHSRWWIPGTWNGLLAVQLYDLNIDSKRLYKVSLPTKGHLISFVWEISRRRSLSLHHTTRWSTSWQRDPRPWCHQHTSPFKWIHKRRQSLAKRKYMKGERMQPRGAPLLCTKMLDKQFLTDILGSVQEEVKDQKADWLGETKCQEFTWVGAKGFKELEDEVKS